MLILLFDICMLQQANLDKVSMQVTLCVKAAIILRWSIPLAIAHIFQALLFMGWRISGA